MSDGPDALYDDDSDFRRDEPYDTFKIISKKAMADYQRAERIFLDFLAKADVWSRNEVTETIINFHLVEKCRTRFRAFVKGYGAKVKFDPVDGCGPKKQEYHGTVTVTLACKQQFLTSQQRINKMSEKSAAAEESPRVGVTMPLQCAAPTPITTGAIYIPYNAEELDCPQHLARSASGPATADGTRAAAKAPVAASRQTQSPLTKARSQPPPHPAVGMAPTIVDKNDLLAGLGRHTPSEACMNDAFKSAQSSPPPEQQREDASPSSTVSHQQLHRRHSYASPLQPEQPFMQGEFASVPNRGVRGPPCPPVSGPGCVAASAGTHTPRVPVPTLPLETAFNPGGEGEEHLSSARALGSSVDVVSAHRAAGLGLLPTSAGRVEMGAKRGSRETGEATSIFNADQLMGATAEERQRPYERAAKHNQTGAYTSPPLTAVMGNRVGSLGQVVGQGAARAPGTLRGHESLSAKELHELSRLMSGESDDGDGSVRFTMGQPGFEHATRAGSQRLRTPRHNMGRPPISHRASDGWVPDAPAHMFLQLEGMGDASGSHCGGMPSARSCVSECDQGAADRRDAVGGPWHHRHLSGSWKVGSNTAAGSSWDPMGSPVFQQHQPHRRISAPVNAANVLFGPGGLTPRKRRTVTGETAPGFVDGVTDLPWRPRRSRSNHARKVEIKADGEAESTVSAEEGLNHQMVDGRLYGSDGSLASNNQDSGGHNGDEVGLEVDAHFDQCQRTGSKRLKFVGSP